MIEFFGNLFGRRDKKKADNAPVSKNEKTHTQEIDAEGSFDENQKATLAIHNGELPDLIQSPTVVIVKRAYKELTNGNLTSQIDLLGDLELSGEEIESIIIVNNPRIHAVLASLDPIVLNSSTFEVVTKIKEIYSKKRLILSDYEAEFLSQVESGKKNIDKIIAAYRENQVSLAILRTISEAVIRIKKGSSDEFTELEGVSLEILGLTKDILDEDQQIVLLKAVKKIIRKRIIVLGIDCSSEDKAYQKIDLGQATNQGCHIAVARGAQYLDISDMDEFHSPNALNETSALARTKKPDVLYRPLRLVNPQHPEQMKKSGWWGLVYYYRSSVLNRASSWKYAYHKPEEDFETAHNSGHIIISNKAFRKHQYPHDDWFEDLAFSRRVQTDRELVQYQLLDSDLLLADRGREESYDGSQYRDGSPIQNDEEEIAEYSFSLIKGWIVRDKNIREVLQNEPALRHLLRQYEQTKNTFIRLENKERRAMRFIVLSEGGLIYKLFGLLSDSTQSINVTLDQLNLTPTQRVFLKNNPALLPALTNEIKSRNIRTPQEACSFVEQSLPELFFPPISPLDLNENNFVNQNSYDYRGGKRLINVSLWIHLYKASQWLVSIISNESASGVYNPQDREKIDSFVKILTAY